MYQQLEKDFSLNGRVAVVTGAASGIGRATACVLAEAGARIVLADLNSAGLDESLRLVEAIDGRALVHRTDVSRREDVEGLAATTVAAMNSLDIWVNAAGTLVRTPILDAAEGDLDRVIAVNLKGAYWGCAAAGRVMKDSGRGSIVNISSSGGESAVPGLSIYSLTKAGLNMLTRTAAKEFGAFGVRVNAIAPGWVDTPMGMSAFHDATGAIDPTKHADGLRQREQASPLGITGTPRDIALAVLYLAADASRFVTGQIIRPNGGVSMP